MDPNCFAPDFQENLQTLIDELRSLEPVSVCTCPVQYVYTLYPTTHQADPNKPVLIAGDPETIHTRMIEERDYIIYPSALISTLVRAIDVSV